MITKEIQSKDTLKKQLERAGTDIKTFAVVDAAKNDTLFAYIKGRKDKYTSLFVKDTRQALKSVAPYLIEIKPEDTPWLVDDILDKSNGYLITGEVDEQDWLKKLSSWIYQKDEKGKVSLFRHYDPVVLSQLLNSQEEATDSIITEIYASSVIVIKDSDEKYNKWTIGSNA